jgi:hypothetical protein
MITEQITIETAREMRKAQQKEPCNHQHCNSYSPATQGRCVKSDNAALSEGSNSFQAVHWSSVDHKIGETDFM